MKNIDLRYQVTIFGNFDNIIPSGEILKFFIDEFFEKKLIPNQFTENEVQIINNEAKSTKSTRLRLSDPENRWDIRFLYDRIDITYLNSNIGVGNMIAKTDFINEVFNILTSLDKRFSKVHKRIGFVTQYLINQFDRTSTVNNFSEIIDSFKDKQLIGWKNHLATRIKVTEPNVYDELLNINYDLNFVNQLMQIENRITDFNGAILNIDMNTLDEIAIYRFTTEKINYLLLKFLEIEDKIKNEILTKFN